MRGISRIVSVFNPRFDQYITTLGNTIYVPDGFLEKQPIRVLETVAHETQHAMDFNCSPVLFVLVYGFPQILAVPVGIAVGLLTGLWWLGLVVGLLLLAPLPAPGRCWMEIRAYRTSLQVGRYVYRFSDREMERTKEWIVSQLSEKWYYWTWPFPSMIKRALDKDSLLDKPGHVKLIKFLAEHDLSM